LAGNRVAEIGSQFFTASQILNSFNSNKGYIRRKYQHLFAYTLFLQYFYGTREALYRIIAAINKEEVLLPLKILRSDSTGPLITILSQKDRRAKPCKHSRS
jgi:hypothetical protein